MDIALDLVEAQLKAQAAKVAALAAENARLKAELTECRCGRVGDAETIGRLMGENDAAEEAQAAESGSGCHNNRAKWLADEIDSRGMEACERLRDEVVAELRSLAAERTRRAQAELSQRQTDGAWNLAHAFQERCYQTEKARAELAEAERDDLRRQLSGAEARWHAH